MKNIFYLLFMICVGLYAGISLDYNFSHYLEIGDTFYVDVNLDYPLNSQFTMEDLQSQLYDDNFEFIKDSLISSETDSVSKFEVWRFFLLNFATGDETPLGPIDFKYDFNNKSYKDTSNILSLPIVNIGKDAVHLGKDSTLSITLDSLKTVLPIMGIKSYTLTRDEILYILGILTIVMLVIAATIFFFKKRNNKEKKPIKPIKKIIPAHLIALEKLDKLEKKGYLEQHEYYQFASELSLIMREYLENRYSFKAKEMDSAQLLLNLENYINNKDLEKDLEDIINITDFVKFARESLTQQQMQDFLNKARNTIFITKYNKEENIQ